MFNIGEIVHGPHFPENVEIKRFELFGDFYIVEAIGRDTNQFYELMLEKDKVTELRSLKQNKNESAIQGLDLQRYLQYLILRNEVKYSRTRALGNKKLLPLPHQIEAVYGRMLQVPEIRFLLADDPGAGKTIMSGMLIKELKARYSVERILILVPPLVVKQWQEELLEKFNEHFHIINRNALKEYGGKNPFAANELCLASMYWAAREDVKRFIQEAQFDLIIVDEAHKMAAYTRGTTKKRISRTKLYQLGESILRKTPHCLLLTATPHKGDMENFRHLMKLIDEDIFSSISRNESLREKTNPFMIRRLKESMKNFDGTPIFPKRTTKTIQYTLTDQELALYDAVTQYVREHFNRAMSKGNNSTAFAMMLLQRRLSSSLESIHLSLKRRYKRLVQLYKQTEEERKKHIKKLGSLELEHYLEEASEQRELIEKQLEQSIDSIDTVELKKELIVLKKLIEQAENLKLYAVERKYQELEKTLFGTNGLLQQNEKILIFTESTDTLNYLERKLLEHVPKVAKIVGSFSMDERRRQVELFRNECQIMLATDAGGESINLQFCNQMINYDIPWNPNKLEQRMGRIHRIGQKNEVFIFNLVAQNTREGSVMIRLLEKMEQMKEDLGSDLVYDFIGEVLEDRFDSLADLMQEAILNREHLDDVIANMEKTLSEEHQKLLQLMQEERMVEDPLDLAVLKREQNDLKVKRIPFRAYSDLATYVLEKKKVRIYDANDGKVKRIERLPKFIRDSLPELSRYQGESYRFTGVREYESEEVALLNSDHPIFRLSMGLMKKENEKRSWGGYLATYDIPEPLRVEIYNISVVDGTGKELENHYIHLAKRENGEIISLDPYWLFVGNFYESVVELSDDTVNECLGHVLKHASFIRNEVQLKRQEQLDKLQEFLEKSFNEQYRSTLEKLEKYQQENIDNRNSALINQMNAHLIDLDMKKEERLNVILRQKNISMKPPKKIFSLQIAPTGRSKRVMATDYKEVVEKYERANGRMNIKMFDCLALVDFYSERFNGEERYILLTHDPDYMPSEEHLEDLADILSKLYIYVVQDGQIVQERAMAEEIFVF
ncbi:DEAD/DEAH box helicase [Anoxybacteroides rupiense]|uniref:DEAD/DEAH box helicase n=1 Tax=Anoxybacteroides rupiense TaxID=311460 RepID=UPI001605645D|nr:helicase-related protein [Anoxybacillus rupiensis]MBB3906531.1 superfamily II DNA or RNA helicase [Anoxybacillus rupiensis]